ncbi:hypothetical protein Tco_0368444 [Tanacetum coccineum]
MKEKCIWFRLCGREHAYTLPEFAVDLGLYEPNDVTHPLFRAHFSRLETNDKECNHTEYWNKIGNPGDGRKRSSQLTDPLLKVFQKILVGTFVHRTSSRDKCQQPDLWLLSLLEEERPANVQGRSQDFRVLELSNSNSNALEITQDFKAYTNMEAQTFKETIIQNMDSIEQCIVERARHEQELQNRLKRLNERKLQIQECKVQEVKASDASSGDKDSSGIVSDKGNDQSLENHSNTFGDKSSRSRNECNDKSTSGDDTDIRPSYDTEPMVEVPYTAEYNVFAVETQHSEQPENMNDTSLMEKVDSNTTPDSSDMCNNEFKDDQNADDHEDERVVLANLIANLKLDIDENKKIQKQLRNANTSLAKELKECKSTLEETNRTL